MCWAETKTLDLCAKLATLGVLLSHKAFELTALVSHITAFFYSDSTIFKGDADEKKQNKQKHVFHIRQGE